MVLFWFEHHTWIVCSLEHYNCFLVKTRSVAEIFLWGGARLEKKPNLVRWATMCLDKERGGLGVKDLGCLNKTLLSKWCWRFALKGRLNGMM